MTDKTGPATGADAMPDILTIPEVARLLRVDPATVYRLASNGALPAGKVGRGWRFLRSDVIDWLQRGGTAPAAEQANAASGG